MMRCLWLIAMFALPSIAPACLVCDTDLGRQVQGGVFDGHFLSTAAAVLLPFPILLLAIAAIHFALPKFLLPPHPTIPPKQPPQ